MYAIVKTGGKQYKVIESCTKKDPKEPSKEITVNFEFETELLDAPVGSQVTLDVVLLAKDDGTVLTGAEAANCKVTATVVEHGKGKKINIFTYKAKKNIRHRQGHRQPYTKLRIEHIG